MSRNSGLSDARLQELIDAELARMRGDVEGAVALLEQGPAFPGGPSLRGAVERIPKVKGVVRLELYGADGRLKESHEHHNLVTNAGKNWLREFAFDSVTPTAIARMGWIAIGTSTTAAAATDTALIAEVARAAITAYTAGGTGVVTVERTFAAGVGTGAITEAGILNAAAVGTLWNRVVFAAVNKTASDTLKVAFTMTFA